MHVLPPSEKERFLSCLDNESQCLTLVYLCAVGVGAVRELSITQNRYGTSDEENSPPQTDRHNGGVGEPAGSSGGSSGASVRSSKKKTSVKKSKSSQQERQSFDECLREVGRLLFHLCTSCQ